MSIFCESCKHYESYHQYPNPNAVARHFCKKCNDEIYMPKNFCKPFIPRKCYYNDYYEESEEHKQEIKNRYKISDWACQVED